MGNEKNGKVIIDVDLYNELHDFREKLSDGGTLWVRKTNGYTFYTYVTTEEVLKELNEENDYLIKKNENLQNELIEKSVLYKNCEQSTTKRFEEMSIYDFIKWKRNLKK